MSTPLVSRRDVESVSVLRFEVHELDDEQMVTAVGPQLRAAIAGVGGRCVVLDLQNVRFMSAAGRGQLVRAYRQVQRINLRLHLINIDPAVRELLTLNRFEQFMEFVELDDLLEKERERTSVPLSADEAVRQSFLHAILDDPEADAPRLIFADWLEEHGDPRGEFIHLQYRLEREPEHPQRVAWGKREMELWDEHEHEWVGPLVPVIDVPIFRRGFLDEAVLRAELFLDHSGYLFEHAPIRRLQFRRVHTGEMPLIAATSALEHLTGLGFQRTSLTAADMQALASSPHLGRLTSLSLEANNLGPVWMGPLLAIAAPLRELNLGRTRLSAASLAELLASPLMPGLTTLGLAGNGLDDDAMSLLAQSPSVAGLKSLDLSANRLTDAGAKALIASPHLGPDVSLRLTDNSGLSQAVHRRLRARFGAGGEG
jgi:anti-anti-sigma factor